MKKLVSIIILTFMVSGCFNPKVTRALQDHLERQERNYQEQEREMDRKERIRSNNSELINCVMRCMRESGFPNTETHIERCQDRCD